MNPDLHQPSRLTVDLGESMWDTIARIRDASPREKNDADTDEIVAALFPVIGRFLRDAAREHIARQRSDDDELSTLDRSLFGVKAQALTNLADEIDTEHKADTTAVFALRFRGDGVIVKGGASA